MKLEKVSKYGDVELYGIFDGAKKSLCFGEKSYIVELGDGYMYYAFRVNNVGGEADALEILADELSESRWVMTEDEMDELRILDGFEDMDILEYAERNDCLYCDPGRYINLVYCRIREVTNHRISRNG